MKFIYVYSDSLSWGIVPLSRRRLPFEQRWPGVLEGALNGLTAGHRVIEDCLNGRRTVWDDPFKPGRNGLVGLQQKLEANAPLELFVLMLGTNDFQRAHDNTKWLSAQGIVALVNAIRTAPLEPGLVAPPILIVSPPPFGELKGPLAPKFAGAAARAEGLADAYAAVASEMGCHYFDASSVTSSSAVDGVHLDAAQHEVLGRALASRVLEVVTGT